MRRRKRKRFRALRVAGILIALVAMGVFAIGRMGGTYDPVIGTLADTLSEGARALVSEAYRDLDGRPRADYHVHMIGLGDIIDPEVLSWRHPFERLKSSVMMSATGVDDLSRAEEQYIERLIELIRSHENAGKYHLYAFDYFYHRDGTVDYEKSVFHASNDSVVETAARYPQWFIPVISVHPFRTDAIAELEKWADRGIRHLKWLPNSQGIPIDDPKLDAFYQVMAQRGITLLVHGGKEAATSLWTDQDLGNPLKLRRPLDLGVKVVVLHCASLGEYDDFDHPGETASAFDLFLRLMDDVSYEGRLFGEISAITQINRIPHPIKKLIERVDLHHRLVNGSDYPLPAMNVIIQTWPFVLAGMITLEERGHLNEIYRYNPLLFDFVLKRTLRHPDTGESLPASVFELHPDI